MKLARLLAASVLTAVVSLGCGGVETEDLASAPVEETVADDTVSAQACPSWKPTATISCGTDANAYCASVGGWNALCVSGCYWTGNYRVKNVWCNY